MNAADAALAARPRVARSLRERWPLQSRALLARALMDAALREVDRNPRDRDEWLRVSSLWMGFAWGLDSSGDL